MIFLRSKNNQYIDMISFRVDRIDNNSNYEPNNCQWITQSENSKKYWHQDEKEK